MRALELLGYDELAAQSSLVMQLLLSIAIAIGLGRILEIWLTVAQSSEETDGYLPQLFRMLLYGLCIFAGLAVFLTANGYRPTELYLSTGVLAAILAFASQQTLGDFFAGLTLSLESPFKIGGLDYAGRRHRRWGNGYKLAHDPTAPVGTMRRLSSRTVSWQKRAFATFTTKNTRIRPGTRCVSLPTTIRAPVKVLLLEAVLRCKRMVPGTLPTIRLSDASEAPYSYMVWVHFPNYPSMFAGREELFREIHDGLSAAGIQVAVDMQEATIFTCKSPTYRTTKRSDRTKVIGLCEYS